MMAALVLAAVALPLYLGLVGIALRLTRQRYAVRLFVGCALAVYGIAAVSADTRIAHWHFAAFFGAGVAAALFAYGAVLKALSLRMLAEIAQSPDTSVTVAQLTNNVVRSAFQERIVILQDRHLIERKDGGFVPTPAGAQSASRIQRVQNFLNIGATGLYWD